MLASVAHIPQVREPTMLFLIVENNRGADKSLARPK